MGFALRARLVFLHRQGLRFYSAGGNHCLAFHEKLQRSAWQDALYEMVLLHLLSCASCGLRFYTALPAWKCCCYYWRMNFYFCGICPAEKLMPCLFLW